MNTRSLPCPGIFNSSAAATPWRRRLLLGVFLLGALPLGTQATLLDFSGGLSGWTTQGTVTTHNTTNSFWIGGNRFSLTPNAGETMVKLTPFGSGIMGAASADTAFGLTTGTTAAMFNVGGSTTNFGILSKSFSLAAGTHSFAWAYAAEDYVPYNDGVFFAVSGGGTQLVDSLARNGINSSDLSGPSAGTLILGSYGSTAWNTHTFTLAAAGTYQVSFGAYNWRDISADPVLFVAGSEGGFTGTPPATSGGGATTSNIDTAADSYSAADLGTTVNPAFEGGTLLADTASVTSAFTLNDAGGTIEAQSAIAATFSGDMSNASGASTGGLTITNSGTGRSVTLTGTNTYGGATTVATGATLTLSGSGSIASQVVSVASGATLNDSNGGLSASAGVTLYGTLNLGAAETLDQVSGSGSLNLGANTLTVSTGNYSGVAAGTGGLTKNGAGALTLSGANTYTGSTNLNGGATTLSGSLASAAVTVASGASLLIQDGGPFRANGAILGSVTVETGGRLEGAGRIRLSVANHGVTAPGNSPGLLTVQGNYTESGRLSIEIDGRAGVGVAGGHDLLGVNGKMTINPGSTLELTRSVAHGFEPAAGDRFLVVQASGGIEGRFSRLDRRAFATQLYFDLGTGYVFGTGVANGANVAQASGGTPNEQAVLGSLIGTAVLADDTGQPSFYDSRTARGAVFSALLNAPSWSDALRAMAPDAYAGLIDYPLQVTRNYGRDAAEDPVLVLAGAWQIRAGHNDYRTQTQNSAGETNYTLQSRGDSAGVTRQFGREFTVGFFHHIDTGTISSERMHFGVKGTSNGLHATWAPQANGRFLLEAGLARAEYDYEGSRATFLGQGTASTGARAMDYWAKARLDVLHHRQLTLTAVTGLAYTEARVDRFTESGAADSQEISSQDDCIVNGELGLELGLRLSRRVQFVGEASYQANFQDARREVWASPPGAGSNYRVTAPGLDEDAIRLGGSLVYRINDRVAASGYYGSSLTSGTEITRSFGFNLRVSL
jgi:autotransporter-associated beta strand protein